MSTYLERLNNNINKIQNRSKFIGDPSSLSQLPADQTENLYKDRIDSYKDNAVEQGFAPIGAIGSADILRRGVGVAIDGLPVVKDIKNAYSQSLNLRNKLGDLLSDDKVQSFLKDPEGTIAQMGEGLRQQVLDSVNNGINEVKGNALSSLDDLPTNLTDVGNTVRQGILGSINSYFNGSGEPEELSAEDQEFKRKLEEADNQKASNDNTTAEDSNTVENQQQRTDLDPADEDEYFDANESALDASKNARTARQALFRNQLKPQIENNLNELNQAGSGEQAQAGSGEQLDMQRATGTMGQAPSEADELGQLAKEQHTSMGITQNIADDVDKSSALPGEAGELGEGEGEEITDAIGSDIPIIGPILDIASIGGLIGSAIKSMSDKSKVNADEQKQQARQKAIQTQITTEQGEIDSQANSEKLAPVNTVLTQQQESPIPVGQQEAIDSS